MTNHDYTFFLQLAGSFDTEQPHQKWKCLFVEMFFCKNLGRLFQSKHSRWQFCTSISKYFSIWDTRINYFFGTDNSSIIIWNHLIAEHYRNIARRLPKLQKNSLKKNLNNLPSSIRLIHKIYIAFYRDFFFANKIFFWKLWKKCVARNFKGNFCDVHFFYNWQGLLIQGSPTRNENVFLRKCLFAKI